LARSAKEEGRRKKEEGRRKKEEDLTAEGTEGAEGGGKEGRLRFGIYVLAVTSNCDTVCSKDEESF
jgi:hypothetical protein